MRLCQTIQQSGSEISRYKDPRKNALSVRVMIRLTISGSAGHGSNAMWPGQEKGLDDLSQLMICMDLSGVCGLSALRTVGLAAHALLELDVAPNAL